MPAELQHVLEERTLKTCVCDEDWTARWWENSLESLQEPLLDAPLAEQPLGMSFQVDRDGTSTHRNSGQEHIEVSAFGPVQQYDRPLAGPEDYLSEAVEVLVPVHPHARIGEQAVDAFDGVLRERRALYRPPDRRHRKATSRNDGVDHGQHCRQSAGVHEFETRPAEKTYDLCDAHGRNPFLASAPEEISLLCASFNSDAQEIDSTQDFLGMTQTPPSPSASRTLRAGEEIQGSTCGR